MKSCPTCKRTYPDDTLAFCLVDGSILSAAYDSAPTQRVPPPRNTSPPATELFRSSSDPQSHAQSTIRAPAPDVPPLYSSNRVSESSEAPRRSLVPWILISTAILLVGIVGVVVVISKMSFGGSSLARQASPSPSASATIAPQSQMCGKTVSAAIFDKWTRMGGESGKLGCPITSEDDAGASPQGTTGRLIQFSTGDGGYLIEHKSGPYAEKVFEVSGCMYKLYASLHGTSSWLGFPVGDGFETDPGARQEFEGGYIVWDRKTYVCDAKKR